MEKALNVHGSQNKQVKGVGFSDNTAKTIVSTQTWNTLFRDLSSILCSSIGTQLVAKHPSLGCQCTATICSCFYVHTGTGIIKP